MTSRTDWSFGTDGNPPQDTVKPIIAGVQLHETVCRKCGKFTESSGRFCQWCGSNLTQSESEPERDTYHSSPSPTDDIADHTARNIVGEIVVLIMIAVGIVVFVMYMTSVSSTNVITNITITEKHPEQVIDENGIIYQVTNRQLWSMLHVNETYQVRYYYNNIAPGSDKYIDGAVINGTTYTITIGGK